MSANIKQLSANPRNPRKIEKKKLQMLAKSMLEFGSLDGFIYNVRTKRLAGGHQRQKVMPDDARIFVEKRHERPTGAGTVAEGYVEWMGERWPYREVDWDESREMAANVAANKGAGEWDMTKLQEFVVELDEKNFDLDLTMFDSDELKDLFGKEFGSNPEKEAIEDEVPETPKDPISKLGDLYEIGNHRLLCGDSTDLKSVELLMNGEKADITFTSPPYNLGENMTLRSYKAKNGEVSAYNQKSDHRTQQEYLDFIQKWTKLALDYSTNVFCNIQLLSGNKKAIPEYWFNFRDNLVDVIIWDKEQAAPALAENVLNSVWEFIFIFSSDKKVSRSIKTGKSHRGLDNIFRLNPKKGKREESSKTHGAVFPVAFAEYFVDKFSKLLVYEPFGGSGSTLIACEKTNRKCYMMELDPHYVDVIVSRWVKYTGIQDIKRNGEKMTWHNINAT